MPQARSDIAATPSLITRYENCSKGLKWALLAFRRATLGQPRGLFGQSRKGYSANFAHNGVLGSSLSHLPLLSIQASNKSRIGAIRCPFLGEYDANVTKTGTP